MGTRNTALAAALVAAVATAAAVTAPAADQVRAAPDTVTSGKAAQVTLGLPAGVNPARVALTPWQPVVTRTLTLPRQPYAAAPTKNSIVVSGEGGVTLLDAAAATSTLLGRFPIDDTCPAVRVGAGVAYVACRHTGLWLLDVRDPRRPRRLGRLRADPITGFTVTGHYLAVLSGARLATYDIAVPAAPRRAGHRDLKAPGRALAARGRTLFIAQGALGLAAYRLDSAGGLTAAGRYATTAPATDVAVGDGVAYVALGSRGVVTLNVMEPSRIRWRGSYHRLGRVDRLRVGAGGRLYAAGGDARVYLLRARRPGRPAVVAARRFAAPVRDVTPAGGGRAWVVTRSALELTDFDGPVPAFSNENFDVGEGVNFGGIRRGVIRGNVAYTADWFSGIHLFDIKDPRHPRLLSSLHIPGSAKGIAVKGNYAFVADDDHGLQVVDVSDPFHPRLAGRLNTSGLAYVPYLAGNRLYLASHGGGFQIIDVSNPRKPRLVASQATPGRAWAVRVKGGTAYVADDSAGLLMFDIRDPEHIHRLAAFRPGGYAEDVVLYRDYALVGCFDQGLYIVDVSDPRHPKQVAHLRAPGNTRGIAVRGAKAYLADWLAGVQVVNLADPQRPRIVGGYDTDGAAWGVRVRGRYAYVMDWWGGFTVLDVGDPAHPRLAGRYHDRGRVHQVIAGDKFIYVAYGRGGLQVFDRRTPLNPIWVTGLDLKGRTTALWLHRPYLYAAGEGGGVTVVDDTDPYGPRAVGRLDLDLDAPLLRGDGQGHLYLYSRGTGISVIDVTHPRNPRRVALIGTPANALWLAGETLYVAAPRHGVQGFDVSDPAQPRPVALWPAPAPATAVTGAGSRLFVAVKGKGLYTLDRRGKFLRQVAYFPWFQAVADMAVAGDHLLVSQLHGGLWDFAIHRDGSLGGTAFYPVLHPSTRLGVAGATAYVAGGTTPTAVSWQPGLQVSDAQDGGVRFSLPAALPRGGYGLVRLRPAATHLVTPLAFTVHLPRRSDRPFTMKDFRKAYKKWRRSHP